MSLQKILTVSLDNKKVIIASDDFIPYPYIKNFVPYLNNSKIYLLTDPLKFSRYTKILLNSFNIKKIKFIKAEDVEKHYNDCIFLLFFGKKKNLDKESLLRIARILLINDQEVIALSEQGVDIDEDSSVYKS